MTVLTRMSMCLTGVLGGGKKQRYVCDASSAYMATFKVGTEYIHGQLQFWTLTAEDCSPLVT